MLYNVMVCGCVVNYQPLYFEEAYELADWYVLHGYDVMDIQIFESESGYDDFGW